MKPDPAGSTSLQVSAREYFEAKIDAVLELSDARRAALQTLIEERFTSLDKALELKAKEYEDHFERLNHDAARVATIQAASVSRERFDSFEGEYRAHAERALSVDRFDGFEKEMRATHDSLANEFRAQVKVNSDRILQIEAGAGARTKLFALIVGAVSLISTVLIILSRFYIK